MNTETARACIERGTQGELYLISALKRELNGLPLEVRHASLERPDAPFDVEITYHDKPILGIENKDIWFKNSKIVGTTIRKNQKKRKLDYAKTNNINHMFTTITMRDVGLVGCHAGLVNRSIECFTFNMDEIIDALILEIEAHSYEHA